jgi:hypothetical protein
MGAGPGRAWAMLLSAVPGPAHCARAKWPSLVVGIGDRWARFGQTRAVDWRRGHGVRREKEVRLGLPKGSWQPICCFLINSNN